MRELQKEIHGIAKDKGWYDQPRTALEMHALIHSEISEATEEVRNQRPLVYQVQGGQLITPDARGSEGELLWDSDLKPEGEMIELADAVIRILDLAEHRGFDMGYLINAKIQYNRTRSYRHGGKAL